MPKKTSKPNGFKESRKYIFFVTHSTSSHQFIFVICIIFFMFNLEIK